MKLKVFLQYSWCFERKKKSPLIQFAIDADIGRKLNREVINSEMQSIFMIMCLPRKIRLKCFTVVADKRKLSTAANRARATLGCIKMEEITVNLHPVVLILSQELLED